MKTIAIRVWNEPAVCIGLLVTIIVAGVQVASGDLQDVTVATVVQLLAPLTAGLATRSAVRPAHPRRARKVATVESSKPPRT